VCEQKRKTSEHGTMGEHDRFGLWIWGVAQIIDVTIGPQAADNRGTGRGLNGLALGTDGDFTVVADADAGLLAPDVRPPRAVGGWTEDGTFFGEGLLLGLERGLPDFAVDFMLVGVGDELIEEVVGPDQFEDVVGGQEGDEAFLPVVVAAFDFAFGLRRWGIKQVDAVEVEGLAELGEGVGVVGVEEGMVVHIEDQGQTVGLEDAGEEIEVGQEGFARVEACVGIEARGVVEDVQQDLFVGASGQPGMRAGVILPEGAVVAGLPAFDGFAGGFVTGVGSELMCEGPAADAGAVSCEVEAAVEFTGRGAVGGGRFGGEEFGEQCGHFGGPVRVMIAARQTGRPDWDMALSAGEQVVGKEFIKACVRQSQFAGGGLSGELAGAMAGQEMTNERSGQTFDQL
jgi:hypothetical protein